MAENILNCISNVVEKFVNAFYSLLKRKKIMSSELFMRSLGIASV